MNDKAILAIAFLSIAVISIGLAWFIYNLPIQQEFIIQMVGEDPCMIELCRNGASYKDVCFGLEVTDCSALKDKCFGEGNDTYLAQWNVRCAA